jgi:hypothetical protein
LSAAHSPNSRPEPIPPRLVEQRSPDHVWTEVCTDLAMEFPTVEHEIVISEVARARSATDLFSLDIPEQLHASATIARNNLRIRTGDADLARLDPENHTRRKHDP